MKEYFRLNSDLSHVLNLLRAVSAGLVLIGHIGMLIYGKGINAAFDYVTGFGHQAVMLFFVLSGFLVSRSAIIGITSGKEGIYQYIADRLIRLYIVLIPALLLTWLLDTALLTWFSGAEKFAYVEARTGLLNLLGNIAFLQTIYVPVFGSNGPLWSLSNEFWYYVLFPLMIGAFLFRKGVVAILPVALIVPVVLMLPTAILKYFTVWLLGAAAWAIRRRIIASRPVAWGIFMTLFLASGFSFAQVQYVGFAFELMIAASLVLLINCYRFSEAEPGRWYHALKVRLFADFSYSLYLVHFPMLVLASSVMATYGWQLSLDMAGIVAFPIIVLAIYMLALMFAAVTELKTLQMKSWIHRRIQMRRLASEVAYAAKE